MVKRVVGGITETIISAWDFIVLNYLMVANVGKTV